MKRAIIVIFISLIASVCYAETDLNPTIEFLVNDKVTMLDWGMFRLEQLIESYLKSNEKFSSGHVDVNYLSTTGDIFIGISIYGKIPDQILKKEDCIYAINSIQAWHKERPLDLNFMHKGIQIKDVPQKFRQNIRDLIFVTVKAINFGETSFFGKLGGECYSSLEMGDSIHCK